MLRKTGNSFLSLFSIVASTFFLLVTFSALSAQDVAFSVTADRTNASLGEQIQVTAQITANKRLSGSFAPQVPKSEDFDVVATNQNQNQSTSIQVINGKMTQSVNITYLFYYTIVAKKTGTFTFPALTCNIDGTEYSSNPFTLAIGKEPVQSSEVRFSLLTNKKNLFAGEQVMLTMQIALKAQTQAQITQQGFSQCLDKLDKLLGKDFSVVRITTQVKGVGQVINGENHSVFTVQFALFPLKPGTITIPSQQLEYVAVKRVQGRRADPFDDFFGESFFGGGVQQIQKTTASNSLTLQVSALPSLPSGFSGAVGSFTMNSAASPKEVAAGEAVTVSIQLRGSTRPGSMGDITLPQIPQCEIFPPEKHVSVDTTATGIMCSKTYKYLVVPKQEGNLTLPAITWTFFDPAQRSFKNLSSEPIALTVTKGKTTQASQTRYLTQEEIHQVGQDIRYIKTGITLKKQNDQPYKSPIFIICFIVPFCIALFSFLYKMQSTRYEKDSLLALRQQALRTANKTLSGIKKKASSLPASEFLAALAGCLEDFITHKYGFPATGKTLDELKQELNTRGVLEGTVERLVAFFTAMDVYRFGMGSLDASSRHGLLEKAEGFVRDLEKRKKGSAS